MKYIFRILPFILLGVNVSAQTIDDNSETFANNESIASAPIAIIPEPVKLVKQAGHFIMPQNITIQVGKSPELKQTVAKEIDELRDS